MRDFYEWDSSDAEISADFKTQLFNIMENDAKEDFVSLINSQEGKQEILPLVLSNICAFNAINCATAVFERETGQEVDVGFVFPENKWTLLHAACTSPELIDFFLTRGARADVRILNGSKYNGMLPFNLGLSLISEYDLLGYCSPENSVFLMIIALCYPSPKMREALEAVRLLFFNTKEVEKEVYNYAKEGKLIEIAVLLMVVREKVLSPLFFQTISPTTANGSMSLRECVASEIGSLSSALVTSSVYGSGNNNQLAKKYEEKLVKMRSMAILIEVFERVGDRIDAYIQQQQTYMSSEQVAREVAWLLKDSGFDLKQKDYDLIELNCEYAEGFGLQRYLERQINLEMWLDFHIPNGVELDILHLQENKMKWCMPKTTALAIEHFNLQAMLKAVSVKYMREYINLLVQSYQRSVGGYNLQFRCALEKLSRHPCLNDWNPKKSVFKLLYILCSPELTESLESIRLLARKLEDIEAIAHCLAMEGRLVELAGLLMVAKEKLIVLTCESNRATMGIRQCIVNHIHSLCDEEMGLTGRQGCSKLLRMCEEKKAMKFSTLLLLDIFERASIYIDLYFESNFYKNCTRFEVVEDIQLLVKKAGFVLKQEDTDLSDINCFSEILDLEQSEKLRRSIARVAGLPLPLQPHKISAVEHFYGARRVHQEAPSFLGAVAARSFHTMQNSKCYSFQISTPIENTTKLRALKRGIPNVSRSKIGSTLALAITKMIKHV